MNFDWQTALDWQTAIVILIVAACAGYVGRLMWHSVAAKRAGCGSCGTCPASATKAEPQVFGLAGLERRPAEKSGRN